MNATSVKKRSCSIPGISNTQTCDRVRPVRRPTSLSRILFKKVLVSRRPFMYISAFPSWASLTAVSAAVHSSGSLMISKSETSILSSSAIALILASSPTRIALAMPRSLAALTASRTALSCATATETVFCPHSFTLEISPSKLVLICPYLI